MSGAIFISHSSADRRIAITIAEGLEKRGARCWLAERDVKPGENYQEAIVAAIRTGRALLLVFSEAANRSDEIKKELSLASRYQVPVIALRIADIEPTDAFAYELSTRQWIDIFPNRARALDTVAARVAELDADRPTPAASAIPGPAAPRSRIALFVVLAVMLLVAIVGALWVAKRKAAPPAVTSLQVRLTGFERLSTDVPAGMSDAMRDELTAALDEEGVVKVSNAPVPPTGDGPGFALGGTIRRDGDQVRVIVRLVNERSGVDLWSDPFTYSSAAVSRVPRLVAIDAGSVLRCGLFGAATYKEALPDGVLSDYVTACSLAAGTTSDRVRAMALSRKVVAAVPGFSWGWSGITVAAIQTMWLSPKSEGPALRVAAIAAADRAIALDPTNSEALAWKSLALDPADLMARDRLLRAAVSARPLSCGCEHTIYGQFLDETGRPAEAIGEYQRAVGAIALEFYSQSNLGFALIAAGRAQEGKAHIDASNELANNPAWRAELTLLLTPITHDYRAAMAALGEPTLSFAPEKRTAWRQAIQALQSNKPDRSAAVAGLMGLQVSTNSARITIGLLGALGADRQALDRAESSIRAGDPRARANLFLPALAHARADPDFKAVADRVGLMRYWREAKVRPDECRTATPLAYCSAI